MLGLCGSLLLLLVPLLVNGNVQVALTNHWNGGFQGNICFTISKDMTGWKIHLMFDQPVDQVEIWKADIASTNADKTEYILTNKPYNSVEHVGDQLCLDFIGHGQGDIAPNVTASMEGVEGGGSFSVTTRPTLPPVNTETLPPGVTRPSTTPLTVPDGDGITASMTVKNDWPSQARFEGWLDFDIDRVYEGWIMRIHFSKPVTHIDVRQADIYTHNADGTVWTLVNNDDKLYMTPGDHFQLRFIANLAPTDHGGAPDASAIIINMGVERNWTVAALPNKAGSKYNYDDVLMKSIMFYEAQRSGKLPDNNRIPYRGDSALNDRGSNGEDLTGGWYDAGDFIKFNFPMAWSTTVLTWGLLQFKDAYDAAGQTDWMYECIKWPLDYLLKCHVADDKLYVQVGNPNVDHGFWGRPEEMTMARPSYFIDASKPGSDVAMETASAFAAGYLAFKDRTATYANTLLEHAKSLWEFAINHPGKYSQSVSAAAGFYNSFNVTDEMCWGSLWLYKATGEQKYLDTARHYFDASPDWGMSWDDVIIGNQILMYNLTGEATAKAAVEGTFQDWFPGGSIPYSPKGLAYRSQWGSLRYASNMAMAALMAAENGIHPDEYRHWAMCQIHYALGDTGRSFVVGFGTNPPVQPHHRASSCPLAPALCNMNILHLPTPNVHTLYGALVGGPDGSDQYTDERDNYVNNEVATDYNAGFQTAVAGLRHLLLTNEHPEQTGSDSCPYRS